MAKDFSEPGKIVEAFTKQMTQRQALRDRHDADYSYWRLEAFKVNTNEGDYDSYTTNAPAVLGNKCIDVCALAGLQVQIPLMYDTETKKEQIKLTEQAFIGLLTLLDKRFKAVGEPSVQGQMAWYTNIRGSYLPFLFLRKEGKNTIPECRIWDTYNTAYAFGKSGINWVIHSRITDAEQAEEEYDLAPEVIDRYKTEENKLQVLDCWHMVKGKCAEKVIVGRTSNVSTPATGEFVKDEDMGLDHIPCAYVMVGSTPLVQSSKITDTYKDQGESCFVNTRSTYEPESRMMSYNITIAGLQAHMPLLTEGDAPPNMPANPYVKDRMLFMDLKLRQKVLEFPMPRTYQDAMQTLDRIVRQSNMGGLSPVTYGAIEGTIVVKDTAATRDAIVPCQVEAGACLVVENSSAIDLQGTPR